MIIEFILIFLGVLSFFTLLVGWFNLADYIGDRMDNWQVGFILSIGVPMAFIIAICFLAS